jgi:4a-hydroxytetrahydrobiopterin dehydratase
MKVQRLSDSEIHESLQRIAGWTVADGKLHKEYRFKDFIHAFGFMSTAALAIEKMNHHPEWLNVYSRVVVDLTTHDVNGISSRDFELAALLDEFAQKLQ